MRGNHEPIRAVADHPSHDPAVARHRRAEHRLYDGRRRARVGVVHRVGDDSNPNGERTGGDTSSQIAVARVDGVVTVFNDRGWEGSNGNFAILDRTLRDGVRAIDAWQR
ncbi:hypothetical protein ACLQ24_07115 [Micromonospora sp. DT4]|uniref:hypothetical protein n=1 Tax=Micromonospora sp. DT4 TaxID=3393438 RepID=UPI003CF5C370